MNGVPEGCLPGESEPGSLASDQYCGILETAGNVSEPGRQRFRDASRLSVVDSGDRHDDLAARGHRRWGEGPAGPGPGNCLDRYVGSSANGVVVSIVVPQDAGERVGTRSAGSGNGVREGILTGKCEPGGLACGHLACYLDRLIFIFNSGGNVGKPGGQ